MTKESKGTSRSNQGVKDEVVRQLATILDETNLSEIEYEAEGLRVRVARQTTTVSAVPAVAPVAAAPAAPAPVAPAAAETGGGDPASHPGTVKAPMVGVAYLKPDPESPEFVKQGDTVSEGQTILLIEAMKTFNPVRAPKAGTVSQILVSDGQPIEFDQPLIVIE